MDEKVSKLRGKHSIMVVELDIHRDGKQPCLYVTSSSQAPEKFFESLLLREAELSLPGSPKRLVQELVLNYKPSRSKEAIRRRLKETKERLDKLGYQVFPHWRVYVLDVDPENPEPLLDRGKRNHVVYVGQTSKTIEARLLEHQGVHRGKDGRFLGAPSIEGRSPVINWSLTLQEPVFSREDALEREAEYAARLRDDEYRVLGDGLTNFASTSIKNLG